MAWKSGQSYSSDLRSRVLAAIDGGCRAKSVARQFQVSVSYIYKALGRRRASGETEARPQRNRQRLKLAAYHAAIAAEVARRKQSDQEGTQPQCDDISRRPQIETADAHHQEITDRQV